MNGAAPIMQARRAQPVATPRPLGRRRRNGERGGKVKGAAAHNVCGHHVDPLCAGSTLRREALHPPTTRASGLACPTGPVGT